VTEYSSKMASQTAEMSNLKNELGALKQASESAAQHAEEAAKRERDLTFAEQSGFSLTLKVKTRYVKGVDNMCKAVIDGYLYDVSYIDKTRTEMYWYLEGVGAIGS